jgi:hypothetical protein
MRTEQDASELYTFSRFTQCCPFRIDASTIQKRRPPEPDILCTVAHEPVAFELVQIVDPDLARWVGEQIKGEHALRAAAMAPTAEARLFAERYANALVFVKYSQPGSRRRAASTPALLQFLMSLPPGFQGELSVRELPSTVAPVAMLRITRGIDWPGPEFQVDGAGWIGQPLLEMVRDKWRKSYATPHRIELLAYYSVQPPGPPALWLEDLQSFVRANWDSSPFARVWVCDLSEPIILWSGEPERASLTPRCTRRPPVRS